MGKVTIFLIMAALMQIGILLFAGTGDDVVITAGNETGSQTTVTNLILQPQSWYNNPFYNLMSASLGLFAVAASIMVFGFLFRNERVIFLGLAATMLTFIAPIINFWQVMSAQGVPGGATAGFVLALFIGPLIFIAVGIILDFSQGKDWYDWIY